jgi:hypothetical protein
VPSLAPSCCSRSSSPSSRPSLPPPLSPRMASRSSTPAVRCQRRYQRRRARIRVGVHYPGGAGADNRVVSDAVAVGVMISYFISCECGPSFFVLSSVPFPSSFHLASLSDLVPFARTDDIGLNAKLACGRSVWVPARPREAHAARAVYC